MARVEVSLDDAEAGELPAVCVMTGAPADGPVAIGIDRSWRRWGSKTVRLPMSQAAFRRWYRRHRVMMQSRFAAMALVVAALAFSAKSPLLALLLLVGSGVVMAGSVRAEHSLTGLQPRVEAKRSTVVLHDVHDAFAQAVAGPSADSA